MADHLFAIMWDCNGLEAVLDVTEEGHRRTWAALNNQPVPPATNLFHWELRARYNSQRHYEIYTFKAVEGITKEDITEMFEASPQTAADTIRRIGHQIYSDRVDTNKVKIV